MKEIQNHGFIPDVIEPDNYVLGSQKVPEEVLQEDGQWKQFLPPVELQSRPGLETSNCTAYGSLNCLEILFYRKFGERRNWSERYVGVLANTTPVGNSPHKVLETIRKESGLIPDEELPFSDEIKSVEDYYAPKPMRSELIRLGKRWLQNYTIKHEWVFQPWEGKERKRKKMLEALKYSPLGIAVYAWSWEDRGEQKIYIKLPEQSDNHWCTLFGYKEGEYWLAFDHYDDVEKRLAWDYPFDYVKRYYLEKGGSRSKFNFFKKLWLMLV